MTLKDFKAAIKVGTQLSVLDHWNPELQHTTRTVTKVQGNGYFYTSLNSLKPDGTPKRLWGDFPKASELRFDGKVAHICIGDKFWVLSLEVTS